MGTKDGSGSHLIGLLYSTASTPWSSAFFCELTRWPSGEEGRRLRHRVISPSASADAVRYCCCRSLRRRTDGISAEARPEKEGGRAGATRRDEAGRLARSGGWAIDSPSALQVLRETETGSLRSPSAGRARVRRRGSWGMDGQRWCRTRRSTTPSRFGVYRGLQDPLERATATIKKAAPIYRAREKRAV